MPISWHCWPAGQVVHWYVHAPPLPHVINPGQSLSVVHADPHVALTPGRAMHAWGAWHDGEHAVDGGGAMPSEEASDGGGTTTSGGGVNTSGGDEASRCPPPSGTVASLPASEWPAETTQKPVA
jgi:hypothetical protein